MPVPPALSCASDGGECPCALPQYKSGERWGIVSTCGRWRIVFDDGKNALMRGEWLYTGFSPQKSHATERAQGLPVSRRRQRHLLPFPCVLRQGICSLRNYKTGGFSLCVCVVWAGKVENSFSRGFIYGGSFPDSFDSAQPRGGRFAPSSKAFATALCALPQGFCSLRNYKTGGFSLCVCVVWASKVENSFSRGFIYGGSFPDTFDTAPPRGGGAVCSVVKGVCSCSVCFAAGYLLFAELQNGRFFQSATEAAYKIPVKRQKVGQKCGQIAATGRKIIEKKIII